MKKLLLVMVVIVLVSLSSYCQMDNGSEPKAKCNTWSTALSGGSMLFYGDLKQYRIYPVGKSPYPKDISERKWGFGLVLDKQLHPAFAIRGQFQSGKLSGFKRDTGAYFGASFTEYGIDGIVNFRNLFFPNFARQKISVYGVLGIGFINFISSEKNIKTGNEIYNTGSASGMVFPLGLGFKYKINDKFDAGLEILLNFSNTDELDAREVSGTSKDKYGYTCLAFTYKIGSRESSLEWDVAPSTPRKVKDTSTHVAVNKIKDTTKISAGNNTKVKEPKAEKTPKVRAGGDSDKDGVPDKFDKCPNTPNFVIADANGCPPDEDQDGVGDYMDKCPNTPSEAKADSVGCPADADNDGVADYLDQCPSTPKNAKVDEEGCPLDTDGDGVEDYHDYCPDTPKGKKVDEDGCPL